MNDIINKFLEKIEIEKLKNNDENELAKFRANISRLIIKILNGDPRKKKKLIKATRNALYTIIEKIPVVTPIVTAFLQGITSEDLGDKIDNLGVKMDNLTAKTDNLSVKIDILGKDLGGKMDNLGGKMDNLGGKMDMMIFLQKQTISILKKTFSVLKEVRDRLPKIVKKKRREK